jgi:hypothetical protein
MEENYTDKEKIRLLEEKITRNNKSNIWRKG